jgi:molybdopterin synthase sulfur carrier subunit
MKVQVRYFASIREALGVGETIELPTGSTLGALRDRLIAVDAAHAAALSRGRAVRAALNQMMSDEGAMVPDGAEVAFFPPVTGG